MNRTVLKGQRAALSRSGDPGVDTGDVVGHGPPVGRGHPGEHGVEPSLAAAVTAEELITTDVLTPAWAYQLRQCAGGGAPNQVCLPQPVLRGGVTIPEEQ